mgnify:CR=1 FL=1
MGKIPSTKAWNNFVMSDLPDRHAASNRYAAAVAKGYMNGALSGGINSFLTNNWELDAQEVLDALRSLGAVNAASELAFILEKIGIPLPQSSQEERWRQLETHWQSSLNEIDFLTNKSEQELMKKLEIHVADNENFYLGLE